MKKQLLTVMLMITALSVIGLTSPVYAQAGEWGNGPGEFIDENGDGFNDLAPDADGDGIPNAYDEDYVKPQDGTGAGFGAKNGFSNGPADGTGNQRKSSERLGNRNRGETVGTGECVTPEVITPAANRQSRR
ncbi:MAG: hypothetical protein K9N35_05175 [Candidatus Marinimicrobia bacterium]|nr:hypothetical protein [Candidatus Neomarinimicrobiota bacterium]